MEDKQSFLPIIKTGFEIFNQPTFDWQTSQIKNCFYYKKSDKGSIDKENTRNDCQLLIEQWVHDENKRIKGKVFKWNRTVSSQRKVKHLKKEKEKTYKPSPNTKINQLIKQFQKNKDFSDYWNRIIPCQTSSEIETHSYYASRLKEQTTGRTTGT